MGVTVPLGWSPRGKELLRCGFLFLSRWAEGWGCCNAELASDAGADPTAGAGLVSAASANDRVTKATRYKTKEACPFQGAKWSNPKKEREGTQG